MMHERHAIKSEKKEIRLESAFGLFGKYRTRRFQQYLQKGKRRSGRHSNPVSRQQIAKMGKTQSGKSTWEFGRKMGDGVVKRVMNVRCAQKIGKEGSGWEIQLQRCSTWPDKS
jgi:hypothetical protein